MQNSSYEYNLEMTSFSMNDDVKPRTLNFDDDDSRDSGFESHDSDIEVSQL